MATYRNATTASARRWAQTDTDHTARRQPRPAPRRQSTRRAIIAAAIREA